jgi:hypothetical protein
MLETENIQKGDYAVAVEAGSDGDDVIEGVVCRINGELIVIRDKQGMPSCLRKFASKVVEDDTTLPFSRKVRHELFR